MRTIFRGCDALWSISYCYVLSAYFILRHEDGVVTLLRNQNTLRHVPGDNILHSQLCENVNCNNVIMMFA
jgi:hypothetical protein